MGPKRLVILTIAIIAVLLSGCSAASVVKSPDSATSTPIQTSATTGSSDTITITGVVRDYQGVPMANAQVTLLQNGQIVSIPDNPQYSSDVRIGSEGAYAFNSVPKGEYTIRAELGGKTGSITYAGYGSTDIFLTNSGQTPTITQKPTQTLATSSGYYNRTYQWTYKDTTWTSTISLSASLYNYYKSQPHDRQSNYAEYALSDYDRPSMKSLINMFNDAGSKAGYTKYDDVMNVVTFVQALPYTSDKVTTGYDEYPRYPVETLVDDGGDCEDTSILTAALLSEMGYGVVLLEFPGHMAVGVKCSDDYPGTYYEYKGAKYFYLETTGNGWAIGQVPDAYKNSQAIIRPMIPAPTVDLSLNSTLTSYDFNYAYYRVHCDARNIGPGTAKNVTVYIAALALSQGDNKVWSPDSTISLGDFVEGSTGWAEATIRIPRNEDSQIECIVYGDNFVSVTVKSVTFNT